MDAQLKIISKYLSFILRHQPQAIGLQLDAQGWAAIDELIDKTRDHAIDRALLELVVETNDKQRFSISSDGERIRANQGHSLAVDLQLEAQRPPLRLFHGTAQRFMPSILSQGLLKQGRHHVHLTESLAVARAVGGRYGKPMILEIAAQAMYEAGFEFFRSPNNVWLVDHVPQVFIMQSETLAL